MGQKIEKKCTFVALISYVKISLGPIALPIAFGRLEHLTQEKNRNFLENKVEASCYILFSKKLNKYYVGSTQQLVEERLSEHLSGKKENGFTSAAKDWIIVLVIPCQTYLHAHRIEHHIKRMKSKTYIENLLLYPELIQKLQLKYQPKG